MSGVREFFAAASMLCLLGGCAAHNPTMWETAKPPKATPITSKLNALPASGQKAAVAVYNFTDQTGQFKPTDGAQTLSRAVTQGATSILVKSLHEAGNRQWFTVIEREKLDNLLRERAVIREMRASYLGETKINPQALPPLLFAGVLLEGGVIGFDSNTKTGGSGARLLGIGGRTQYREDTVTVYLRAVSVKTGEVLTSVSSRKSIASVAIGADAFQFVAFRELLELEAGVTYNEPDELALRQAIEAVVYALVMEGAMQDLWCMTAPEEEVAALLTDYVAERDSISKSKVVLPSRAAGQPALGVCDSQKVARPAGRQQQISPSARTSQFVANSSAAQGPVSRAPLARGGVASAPSILRPSPKGPISPAPQSVTSPQEQQSSTVSRLPAESAGSAPMNEAVPSTAGAGVGEQPQPANPEPGNQEAVQAAPVAGKTLSFSDTAPVFRIPLAQTAAQRSQIIPSSEARNGAPSREADPTLYDSFAAMIEAAADFGDHAAREMTNSSGFVRSSLAGAFSSENAAPIRVVLDRSGSDKPTRKALEATHFAMNGRASGHQGAAMFANVRSQNQVTRVDLRSRARVAEEFENRMLNQKESTVRIALNRH